MPEPTQKFVGRDLCRHTLQRPYKLVLTSAYVGSQGRNLFLRDITNRIIDVRTNSDPTKNAIVIRQFDIVQGDSVLKPFAEIDVKESGGTDSYNALQLSVGRRALPLAVIFIRSGEPQDHGNSVVNKSA